MKSICSTHLHASPKIALDVLITKWGSVCCCTFRHTTKPFLCMVFIILLLGSYFKKMMVNDSVISSHVDHTLHTAAADEVSTQMY